MGNLILKAAKDHINKVHDVLNFVIPVEKVTQYIPAADHKPLTWDEHAGIYIGKMLAEDEGIYNDSTLKGMFEFAKKNSKEEGIIHVYIGSILYESLVDTEHKQEIVSLPEQITKIYKLAKKAGVNKKDIIIHNLGDAHKELFSQLKLHGLKVLEAPVYTPLTSNNTSLQVAQVLFSAAQKNPEFKQKIMKLTPQELLEELPDGHPLTYYGMIECAFRIVDALQGITTQGGLVTQKKYDDMIQRILSGETNIQEIDQAFTIIGNELLPKLGRRYFKNDTYKKLLPKEEEKIKFKRNTRNLVIAIAATIAAAIGGYQYKTYVDRKHAQELRQENLKRFLADKSISRLWEGKSSNVHDDERKVETIEERAHSQSEKFENIYGLGDITREELEDLMIGVFCTQKEVRFLGPKDVDDAEFIRDIFVPTYRPWLLNKGFSLIPYELDDDLAKHENTTFLAMLDLPKDLDVTKDLLDHRERIVNGNTKIYRGRPWRSTVINGRTYIGAGYLFDQDGQPEYISIDQGKRFVEDFFWEKYPILRDITRTYRIRYMNKRDSPIDEVEFDLEVKPLIIKTCIRNHIIQDLDPEGKRNKQAIIDSLLDNKIVPAMRSQLPCKNQYFNQPYEYVRMYMNALKNTLHYNAADDELYRVTSEKLAAWDFKHIGYYQDSTGTKYKLVTIKYHGKDFFLAGEADPYNLEPGAFYGKQVAQELIKLWGEESEPTLQKNP